MKAGLTFFFQHPKYLDEVDGPGTDIPDLDVVQRDLAMAECAETLGYDAVWSVEHHFTGYTMVPDVIQVLAYIAATTKHITVGSGAVILPWHNPVRVAESICLLDNLSRGRFVLGLGRGLGRIEFEGIGVPMGESRERFVEAAQIVLTGLERGYVEFEGKHFNQPKRWLRPAPTRSFKGRTYSAAVSPESLEIMASLGVGLLITPQKPWDTTVRELHAYRAAFEKANEQPAPPPIVTCQVYCDNDGVRARERAECHLSNYYRTVMKHYELKGAHLETVKDYDYYRKIASNLNRVGDEEAALGFARLQVYGTPKECLGQIEGIRDRLDCDQFNAIFSYSDMSDEEAKANMLHWTESVLPKLKTMQPLPKSAARAIA